MIALFSVLFAILAAGGIQVSARHPNRASPLIWTGAGLAAVAVLAGLGRCFGGPAPLAAVELGSGAAPIAAALLDALAGRAITAVAVCALVIVPLGLWMPNLTAALFGADGACVHDFGGALGLVVGPSALVLAVRSTPAQQPRGTRQLVGGALSAIGLLGWLAASEGVVDAFTGTIVLGALVGPLAGGVGWLIGRVLRGSAPAQGVALGSCAGGAVALSSVTVLDPLAIGVAAALAGVIAGSARGARAHPAAAVFTGALIGLLSIGLVSDDYGFVLNARVDVLGAQLAGALTMTALGVGAGTAIRLVAGRTGEEKRWTFLGGSQTPVRR